MTREGARKRNIEQLLGLAGAYKGLSRKKLAEALGRDPTKLFPETGNPKLDYVIRLADLLDWPVGDVAEVIWESEPADMSEADGLGFEALDDLARQMHREGKAAEMLGASQRMALAARTPHERALAAHRESGAWNSFGRFNKELEAIRRGLQESPIPADLRSLLRVNLSHAYYTLGQHIEARAMARDLLEEFAVSPPTSRAGRASRAFAAYVLGHANRSLMAQEPERSQERASAAAESLASSRDQYETLAAEFDNDPWRGIANTCLGGLIEVEVELGRRSAGEAIAEIHRGLEAVGTDADGLKGDRLESYGWWCVFGCNITLRHLAGGELQRQMAVFTNKGYQIADRLNNWAMREQLFSMEFVQRQQLNVLAGFPVEWTIDADDVRVLVGTMGRFPQFKSTGWKILRTATVVGGH
ncbi:MAG: hypothetical protein JNM80_03335 [Phycisphaerae bacterium]|nr:hypothetical protein [Phycisphaerae bacterium]